MAKTFNTQAEAFAAIGPLFQAGKIGSWTCYGVFGKTFVKVRHGASWFKLTEAEFAALIA
jgi:hypothetical protein